MSNGNGGIFGIGAAVVVVLGVIMFAWPQYNVWQQGLAGEAELKRAEQNRKIKVQEAQAYLESSKLFAQAEVERAGGAAEANNILSQSLGGADNYLRWKYIQMLEDTSEKPNREIIYLPTEAGIPILEATRGSTTLNR